MKKLPLTVLAATFALSGCNLTGRAATPTPTPAVGKIGMTGGLAGDSVGKSLSAADRRLALEAEYKALEYTPGGRPVSWKTAGSGTASGDVVAAQPYRVGSQDCRQYSHTVFDAGQAQTARGTACRNADGSWTPLT